MKILQLIPNISSGGAERFVVDLSNELVKAHQVTLVTLYDESDNDLFREQLSGSVNSITLRKKLGFDWQILGRLLKVIIDERPDVIHTHLRALNYLMPLIPLLKNTAVFHTIHNDAFKECPSSKIRKIRKLFYKGGRVIPVTISKASANSFNEAYGQGIDSMIFNGREMPQKSIRYKTVVTEIENLKKNMNTKVFLNIGRLIPQKNQLMLVDAFSSLVNNKNSTNAILLVMGGGRNTNESKEIMTQLKRAAKDSSYIYLIGECSNSSDYLFVADYFCLSSNYEGMPITLIEAFATGAIPVCTPVGGVPEVLSELDQKLVSKSIDKVEYYESLKYAYDLPVDQRKELERMAQQLFIEKFSMKICADKYLQLYHSKLKK